MACRWDSKKSKHARFRLRRFELHHFVVPRQAEIALDNFATSLG